jgi:hypothetical protein
MKMHAPCTRDSPGSSQTDAQEPEQQEDRIISIPCDPRPPNSRAVIVSAASAEGKRAVASAHFVHTRNRQCRSRSATRRAGCAPSASLTLKHVCPFLLCTTWCHLTTFVLFQTQCWRSCIRTVRALPQFVHLVSKQAIRTAGSCTSPRDACSCQCIRCTCFASPFQITKGCSPHWSRPCMERQETAGSAINI